MARRTQLILKRLQSNELWPIVINVVLLLCTMEYFIG